MKIDENATDEWNRYLAEFHRLWLSMGCPHPSSNAYLKLNREYFFGCGFEAGREMYRDEED